MDDRGDYNSSPCTSYRRAKNGTSKPQKQNEQIINKEELVKSLSHVIALKYLPLND